MNIGFSDGNIEYRFTENIFFILFYFFFVQYVIFIRLIHLFLYASAKCHSAR